MVERVHHIAERQKSPAGFIFTRIDGTETPDMDDEIALVEETIHKDDMSIEATDDSAADITNNEEPPKQQLAENLFENDEYMDTVEALGGSS